MLFSLQFLAWLRQPLSLRTNHIHTRTKSKLCCLQLLSHFQFDWTIFHQKTKDVTNSDRSLNTGNWSKCNIFTRNHQLNCGNNVIAISAKIILFLDFICNSMTKQKEIKMWAESTTNFFTSFALSIRLSALITCTCLMFTSFFFWFIFQMQIKNGNKNWSVEWSKWCTMHYRKHCIWCRWIDATADACIV